MGALFSRNKADGKKRTFKFWPSSHDHLYASKKSANSSVNISKSQPITAQQQGWTEVSLSPPRNSVLDNVEKDIVTETPVPPPRKHRNKTKTITPIFEKITVQKSSKIETDTGTPTPTNLVPVEESIIIPKKEPVHICDGTHHHVRNIVNGKIIHDTIVVNKKEQDVEKEKHLPIQETPNRKPETEKVFMRPKNLSTVSLPNFNELIVNKADGKHSHNKDNNRKPKRNISVVSLPTHNKTTLSDATIARLENYMARCKSFGTLPPKELLEKLQNEIEFDSDSDESWDGLDVWDMEIIEHVGNTHQQSPVVPRSRLAPKTLQTIMKMTSTTPTTTSTTETKITSVSEPTIPETTVITNISQEKHVTHSPHTHSYLHTDFRVPTPIEEDDEVVKVVPQGIITLKKREGRRESIDDFFDSTAENPIVKMPVRKPDNYLGRRGSDGFFGYNKANILKDLSLKPASHFSQSLLESESAHTKKLAQRRQSAGAALHYLHATKYIDDEVDEDSQPNVESSVINEEELNSESNEGSKDSKRDSLIESDDFVLIPKSETVNNKSESSDTEHSNLLKFLKNDTSTKPTENKSSN